MQAKSGFPDWLFKQKNRNLSLFRSIWLQNFYLAIWLLFGTFATSSLQKFFLKSCEWRVQHVPVSIKRETGHHTVAQLRNVLMSTKVYLLQTCEGWNFVSAPAPHPQNLNPPCTRWSLKFLLKPALVPKLLETHN